MPWVRIDENAMDHPKVGALSDGSFRLWVQALAYCQKHLTDGYVSNQAVRSLFAFSPKRRADLEACGLWDAAEGGIAVHDYLQWNDSRASVTAKRDAAKDRMRAAREKRSREVPANSAPRSPERSREVLRGVVCSEGSGSASTEEGSGETNDVQHFIDRWQELHQQYRGVAYLGNPQKDYFSACELIAAFGYAVTEAIAVYGLNDPDPFMRKGTVTLTMLKSRASKYAEELKAKKLA